MNQQIYRIRPSTDRPTNRRNDRTTPETVNKTLAHTHKYKLKRKTEEEKRYINTQTVPYVWERRQINQQRVRQR